MTTTISTADLKRRMHGAVEALRHDLGGLRTGRASTALLDPVHVEVYGSNMEWSFRGGLAAILALLFFTTFNDLGSIGLWDRLQRLIG